MTTDRHRFEALVDAHFRDVLGYALRRAPVPEDAADIAAETFLTAWRRLDRVPDGPDARLWLFGAARMVLANARRGARRRDALTERLRAELRVLPAPHVPDDEPGDTVRRAIAALPTDDREILALTAWEGLDPAQAAVVLGIPPATARTRLHRARRRLRDGLIARGLTPRPTDSADAVLEEMS